MKQSLACERFEWIIVPLHWDAVLGGFHVWSLSEQHDTLHHPNGEFFWKFLLYMSLFLHFFKSHLVMDLDIIAIRCWE